MCVNKFGGWILRILIAGATGMVGSALVEALKNEHDLILVGRDEKKLLKKFPGSKVLTWQTLINFNEPVDTVIHLSGKNIGDVYWTEKVKRKLIDSRVNTAHQLLEWITATQQKTPRVLATNAIGYYGCQVEQEQHVFDENDLIAEDSPKDFLQKIAFEWQNAWKSEDLTLSICWMRFGVVLQKNQGMLKKLMPSFFFGMGAVLGHGKQMISWVDLDDLVAAILWVLQHPEFEGPINMVSPNAVSQREFAKTFAKILNRPQILRLPAKLVSLLFGQMGLELLLSGQHVYPKRLMDAGFKFKYENLDEALNHEYED